MGRSLTDELARVRLLFAQLSVSVPILQVDDARMDAIERLAASDATLTTLRNDLFKKLVAVTSPDAHLAIGQAYTAYAEACFFVRLNSSGINLVRTPGTGGHKQKRPDFAYSIGCDSIYFEVKALDITDPVLRHVEIGERALELHAEQEERARSGGRVVHASEMPIAAHVEGSTAQERVDETIRRLRGLVKRGQLQGGPTTLAVDLGRLWPMPQGLEAIEPVFSREVHGFSACESGELWHIACGLPGERIFIRPEFEGESNLGQHQEERGVLHEFPELLAVTFVLHAWNAPLQVLTIWNPRTLDQWRSRGGCYDEVKICETLLGYSDALNNVDNEFFTRGAPHSF